MKELYVFCEGQTEQAFCAAVLNRPRTREGLLESFSLGSYLQVLDYTSRLYRQGKSWLRAGVRDLFDRLGSNEQYWTDRLRQMLTSKSLRGRYFPGDRERLRQVAATRGRYHLANLSSQPSS